MNNGNLFLLSVIHRLQPCPYSVCRTCALAAMCAAVSPFLLGTHRSSTPLVWPHTTSTHAAWPSAAASCRAVLPSALSSAHSRYEGGVTRHRKAAHSVRPFLQA
jgi:hypothetical protein